MVRCAYVLRQQLEYEEETPRRSNPGAFCCLILIGAALKINQVVVPATPPLFIPTATERATRSRSSTRPIPLQRGHVPAIQVYRQAVANDPDNPSIYLMARCRSTPPL
jgi:hypothetical protein